jgi:hypothetical protein
MRASLFALSLLCSGLIAASRIWTMTESGSRAAVIATTVIVLQAVAVIGMLVGHARWARRLAIGLAVLGLVVVGLGEFDGWWWPGVLSAAVALGGLIGPGMKGTVRDLAPALGPPPQAVVLPLVLMAAPGLVAVTRPDGIDGWAWLAIGCCWAAAALYAKAGWGGLTAVRALAPLALATSAVGPPVPAVVDLTVAGAVLALAWTANARVAIRPLVQPGSRKPILPEMVPADLMDRAGYDSRGRVKGADR